MPFHLCVDQLVGASEADADLGFMARLMALCSLPRSNPGDRHQYKRVNGPYKLILSRTGEYKLPFGNFPRLLIAWICTEAGRTRSRELVLRRRALGQRVRIAAELRLGAAELRELNRIGVNLNQMAYASPAYGSQSW